MKVRIVSDLHVDVNNTYKFGFCDKLNEADITLIAGDIGGHYLTEIDFLNRLQSDTPIYCVGGNHLGYDYLYRNNWGEPTEDGTKEDCIKKCRAIETPIYYLENQARRFDNYLIIAGTMYTNFELYGKHDYYKECGERGLNDFRLVHTNRHGDIRRVTAQDYIEWFNEFKGFLETKLESAKEDGLDVIVLTHFAPSPQSISPKYNGGLYRDLNPTYAVDLEQLILDNPHIKLWAHGHMHDIFDYNIGSCRVVCNPYGYFGREQTMLPGDYEGVIIDI